MPLEKLVSTIETLKERINTHGSDLAASEARTRAALIDPVLTALGWDTSDPEFVTHEIKLSSGRADYALIASGDEMVAVVEAKALGRQLDNAAEQLVRYAFTDGVPYAISSDGDLWRIYNIMTPKVKFRDRLVCEVSIANDTLHECSLKLLLLWHPNLASGTPVRAKIPITHTNENIDNNIPDTSAQETQSSLVNSGWVSLENYDPPKKTKGPLRVRFPDDSEYEVDRKSWSGLFKETVKWLWGEQLLSYSNIPVTYRDGDPNESFILNTSPEHRPGTPIRYPGTIATTPLYYNSNPGMGYFIYCSKRVLEHCNQNPAEVYILSRQ